MAKVVDGGEEGVPAPAPVNAAPVVPANATVVPANATVARYQSMPSVGMAQVIPCLGTATVTAVIQPIFTPERRIKTDVPLDLYANPNYGAVNPMEVTKRGTQVRQLVVKKAGPRERLKHATTNQREKLAQKVKWEQYANYCYVASELVLYVILGWCASQVVQYQEEYGDNEYKYCFVDAQLDKEGDEFDDVALADVLPGNVLVNGSYPSWLPVCGDDSVFRNGAYCYSRGWLLDDDGDDAETCPDLSTLPKAGVVYAAAVIYTFCKLMNAVCTFFSTKFEAEWLFKIHGVYYHAEKLVEDFAHHLYARCNTEEQRRAIDSLRLPELIPKARDDWILALGLFEVACVCVGNWLISRGDVVTGLILTVLAAMAIASTIHKHVASQREITYLTWEIVDRIVSWAEAAFVPAIDPQHRMHHDLMDVRNEIEIPNERDAHDTLEIEDRLKQLVAKRVTELGLPQDAAFPQTVDEFLDMAMKASDDSSRENLGSYMTSTVRRPEKKAIQIQRGKFRDRAGKSYDQAKKGEWKKDFENWAKIADIVGFLTLFGFLGITAAQVVQYQNDNTPAGASSMTEYCACFDETCAEDDMPLGAKSAELDCPDPNELPNQYLMYFSAGGHAFFLIASVVFTFFSRDASTQEMARTRNSFGIVLTKVYSGGDASELDLIPDDMDIASYCVIIFMIVLIGVGNWLMSKKLVTAGLIIAVLAARGLAYVASQHIDTHAATDLATYQFVERCAKMALMCPTLDQKDQKDLLTRIGKLEDSRSLMKKPPGVKVLS